MSDFTIRSSLEVELTKAPAIAIAGASGSGKTESAMRLARGWCNAFGPNEKFAVIDTEEKRALYKKSRHQPWDWIDFQPPFTPERTWEALAAVKGYRAVILDSTSHEYAGEGGLQEIADEELLRLSGGDPKKMERLVAPSWKPAKRRHKHELMSRLIRYPTLIICCLRAEPKVKFLKEKFRRGDGSEGEKTTIVDAGFQPICEKMFMYEMLASFMMYAERAGIPEQVKALEEDLKPIFLLDQPIDEATGERLAAWAQGRAAAVSPMKTAPGKTSDSARSRDSPPTPSPAAAPAPAKISAEQVAAIEKLLEEHQVPVAKLCAVGNIAEVSELTVEAHDRAVAWIKKHAKPVVDEASILLRIDSAQTRDAAAEILDGVREQPFYARATEAFTNRWSSDRL